MITTLLLNTSFSWCTWFFATNVKIYKKQLLVGSAWQVLTVSDVPVLSSPEATFSPFRRDSLSSAVDPDAAPANSTPLSKDRNNSLVPEVMASLRSFRLSVVNVWFSCCVDISLISVAPFGSTSQTTEAFPAHKKFEAAPLPETFKYPDLKGGHDSRTTKTKLHSSFAQLSVYPSKGHHFRPMQSITIHK